MRELLDSLHRLSARERIALVAAVGGLLLFGLYLGVEQVFHETAKSEKMIATRMNQLEQLHAVVERYRSLDARLERLKSTFAESQLTFEQVTAQLDSIVRQSIGSDKYDLNRGRSLTPIGDLYQKQEFTLKVSALSLEQVVELLFRLEHGESPLLLGKVDLLQSSRDKSFSATLEIFSVLKAQ